jgi:hypothetical protein
LIDESVVWVTYGCELDYNGEGHLSGIYEELDNRSYGGAIDSTIVAGDSQTALRTLGSLESR